MQMTVTILKKDNQMMGETGKVFSVEILTKASNEQAMRISMNTHTHTHSLCAETENVPKNTSHVIWENQWKGGKFIHTDPTHPITYYQVTTQVSIQAQG